MLPTPRNYAIYPSVVPADKPVEMTICAAEKAFLMPEDSEYRLTVISFDADEPNYLEPSVQRCFEAAAHGGMLRFACVFPGEQQHLIILEAGERRLQEFRVFSLHEDLYALRPLKGDLHGHSYRSDGKRDPAALAGHYREQGYEFFTLTDHNRYYPGGEIDETYAGVSLGLTRVYGEEVHTPGSVVHIVHAGGKTSVAEQYANRREQYNQDIAAYLPRVPQSVPAQYHDRYARAMWATDRIHEAGGLAIFPHSFWRPGKSQVYNVCGEFAQILIKSGMFDAYELLGGMQQAENNRSVAMWAELRAQGLSLPVVGSSDVHALENSAFFGHLFTLCFAERSDNDSIISAVRAGRTVAVESYGEDGARQYRCYGSLRLVTYAHFLLENYYPGLQRICQGEGVAMRAYAMGEADKALIELQVAQSERYRRRFFGAEPPAAPCAQVMAFEEKWREVHLRGPLTKGSSLNAPPVTRQI